MKEAGISAEDALAALGQIQITPVFTAHPTEVARQTVLLKRRRIAQQLERLDRLPLTAEEAEDCEDNIRAEVTSLWQTDEVRLAKPTVNDEIRMGLRYFRLSLFDSLPKIYDEIVESFRDVYGLSPRRIVGPERHPLRLVDWRRPRRQSAGEAGVHSRRARCRARPDSSRISLRRGGAQRSPQFFAPPDRSLCRPALARSQHYERTIPGVHLAWGPDNQSRAIAAFFPTCSTGCNESRRDRFSRRLRQRRGIRAGSSCSCGIACAPIVENAWRRLTSVPCSARCASSDSICTRSTSASMPACTRRC